MKENLKIGVSGVRGVVGASFSPQLAISFAEAFGTLVGRGAVLIGRDTRPSGPMVEHAVVAGLMAVGCTPVLAGVVPTPTLLYLVRSRAARGGIMITASHNAASWNALKFVDRHGMFLPPDQIDELLDIYHQQDFPWAQESDLRRSLALNPGDTAVHFDRVESYVDASAIRAAGFRVAVDCCNGVGALHSPPFLRERFSCDLIAIHDQVHGEFEREPEPLPEHLGALSDAVRENMCAVGFAQDPDGDRLAVVNEKGEPIGEAQTVALALRAVLQLHGKGTVAVNYSAGKAIEEMAQTYGSSVVRARTGEVYVSETMLASGAVAGGEHTGGIIVPAVHMCRDSYTGMALILELMARTGRTISDLCNDIPRYHLVKDKIPMDAGHAPAMLRAVRKYFAGERMSFEDGIVVDFGDRWVQVRRSHTEPVLRIIAEAPQREAAEQLMTDVQQLLQASRVRSSC
jgi:phosphomannomutase